MTYRGHSFFFALFYADLWDIVLLPLSFKEFWNTRFLLGTEICQQNFVIPFVNIINFPSGQSYQFIGKTTLSKIFFCFLKLASTTYRLFMELKEVWKIEKEVQNSYSVVPPTFSTVNNRTVFSWHFFVYFSLCGHHLIVITPCTVTVSWLSKNRHKVIRLVKSPPFLTKPFRSTMDIQGILYLWF